MSTRVPNSSTPPRCGWRFAASLQGARLSPRVAPSRAALAVVRNVLRLRAVVCAGLSMLALLWLRLNIRRANAAATMRKGTDHAGLVAFYLLGRHRSHGQFVQVKVGEFDVDDVPGLGIQLLAPRLVEGLFGFVHQRVVALVAPAGETLGVIALGVQVTLEEAIRIKAVAVPLDMAMKLTLVEDITPGEFIERF